MVELLVLADDFTGAIDTGVQFAQQSVPTLVSNRFQQLDQGAIRDFSVFVIDIESRHMPPKAAESRVIETVELALHNGIRSFYKKTDSTLRGNIGSELSALLAASSASVLAFIPAYPKNGRTTVAGRQFVNGILLHRSVYSKDLQNPVRTSYIPDIIAAQTPIPVRVVEHAERIPFECNSAAGKRIIVLDARTDEDLRSIADHLKRLGFLQVSAGCAGFAEYLPEMLCLKRGVIRAIDCPTQLIIVCGSINPVSLKQIEVAVQGGIERIILHPEQLLGTSGLLGRSRELLIERVQQTLSAGSDLILQTAQGIEDIQSFYAYCREQGIESKEIPKLVARAVGELVVSIVRFYSRLTPVVFGGDTAAGIIEALKLPKVFPIAQVAKGVGLSRLTDDSFDIPLITKAGGFASPTIIEDIQKFIS
jgi:uncharacterized protein YgbK (DUF1537 family)